MDEVEFHAPPRESKSKRWLSFHPFSGLLWLYGYIYIYWFISSCQFVLLVFLQDCFIPHHKSIRRPSKSV